MQRQLEDLPRQPAWFHPVGQGHVVAPDVELPLPESDDPAEDVSGVNADPHVHVGVGHLTDSPVEKRRNGVSGIGLVPKRANNQPDYLGD